MIDMHLDGSASAAQGICHDVTANLIIEEKGERPESLQVTLR